MRRNTFVALEREALSERDSDYSRPGRPRGGRWPVARRVGTLLAIYIHGMMYPEFNDNTPGPPNPWGFIMPSPLACADNSCQAPSPNGYLRWPPGLRCRSYTYLRFLSSTPIGTNSRTFPIPALSITTAPSFPLPRPILHLLRYQGVLQCSPSNPVS